MIRDRSILARFSPDGSLRQQYLARNEVLFAQVEWEWQDERPLAYVFDSHAEAEAWAKANPYKAQDGRLHESWALVCGGEPQGEETPRERAAAVKQAAAKQRSRFGASTSVAVPAVAPEETFEVLERRHLA